VIIVTRPDHSLIYINQAAIVSIQDTDGQGSANAKTKIITINGFEYVIETKEEVFRKIRAAV
jgi:ABC-type branched-subunit amino acid transport system substrate-binding protein